MKHFNMMEDVTISRVDNKLFGSGVEVLHIPTGFGAASYSERTYIEDKTKAMLLLKAKLEGMEEGKRIIKEALNKPEQAESKDLEQQLAKATEQMQEAEQRLLGAIAAFEKANATLQKLIKEHKE